MQKRLIYLLVCATLSTGGCSYFRPHRIDIQQGNVITQDMVDQLQPGMDKRKILLVMGSPLVQDVFHADRWDYVYELYQAGELVQEKQVTLYFENEQLARIEGDLRPNPQARSKPQAREVLITVPPQPEKKKSLIDRTFEAMGFDEDALEEEGL